MRQMEIRVVAAEVRALSSNNALQGTLPSARCASMSSLAALAAPERGRWADKECAHRL